MIESVQHKIKSYRKKKFAVAVSGGVDSMVLVHLLIKLQIPFVGLHCNFNLRSGSEGDEAFVRQFFENHNIPLQVQSYSTLREKKAGESTQMVARRLRYQWFKDWVEMNDGMVLMGHHLDDRIESFWLNLNRGTGIKGLQGMPEVETGWGRPMIEITKAEVVSYAQNNNVPFVHDQSNDSLNYMRNQIRHLYLPLLTDEIDNESWIHFFRRQNKLNFWIEEKTKSLKNQFFIIEKGTVHIKKSFFELPFIWGYQVLKNYGLKQKHEALYAKFANADTSSQFDFEQFIWFSGREMVQVVPKKLTSPTPETKFIFEQPSVFEWGDWMLEWSVIDHNQVDFQEKSTLYFALPDAVENIEIRSFKEGDAFLPYGMKGQKKVSDYFNEKKVLAHEKHKYPLVVFDDEVVGVLPFRGSETYKIMGTTIQVLKIVAQKVG